MAEADRRIGNLIGVGTIVGIEAATGRARVQLGDLTTPFIPVGQMRAGGLSFWWMPQVGEQVVVAAPSGDVAQSIVIASVFAGNQTSADAGTPKIELGGGTLQVNGSIELTGDVIAQGVSLVQHTHRGAVPGDGDTGEPNP